MYLGQQDSSAECEESARVPWAVCGPIIGTLILVFTSIFFVLLRGDLSSILDEGLNIKAPKQEKLKTKQPALHTLFYICSR